MDYRDVTLAGVIPGGESFKIPVPSGASSIIWLPPVEPGTPMFILAGDSRGHATGGSSTSRIVANGSRDCLSGGAYSRTQSPFAGQVSATSPPYKDSDNGGGINSPLVIGVIAGLLALFALAGALFYLRYRREHRRNKVDLCNDNDSSEPVTVLEPTPFPAHPHRGSVRRSFEGNGYRYSSSAFQSAGPPQTPIGWTFSPYHDQPPSNYVSRGVLSPPLTASSNTWGDSRTDTGTHITSQVDGGRPQAHAGFSVINPDGGGPVVGGSGWRESRKQPPPRAQSFPFLQHQDAGTAGVVELPPSYVEPGKSLPPTPATATAPP